MHAMDESQARGGEVLPAHTITFVPPLTVLNLLPMDIHFLVRRPSSAQVCLWLAFETRQHCLQCRIPSGQYKSLTSVNLNEGVDWSLSTEHYRLSERARLDRNFVTNDNVQSHRDGEQLCYL